MSIYGWQVKWPAAHSNPWGPQSHLWPGVDLRAVQKQLAEDLWVPLSGSGEHGRAVVKMASVWISSGTEKLNHAAQVTPAHSGEKRGLGFNIKAVDICPVGQEQLQTPQVTYSGKNWCVRNYCKALKRVVHLAERISDPISLVTLCSPCSYLESTSVIWWPKLRDLGEASSLRAPGS